MNGWRVCLCLILVVMLPLRSALASTMATPWLGVPGKVASVMAEPPCPHHAANAQEVSDAPAQEMSALMTDHTAEPHHDASHASCDVCHVSAFGPVSWALRLEPLVFASLDAFGQEAFVSVALPVHHRPPITN